MKILLLEDDLGFQESVCEFLQTLGYEVTALHRIEFGKYQLGDLKPGQYIEVKK